MKQRTRPMHGSDEFIGYMANNKKEDDYNDIQLHKVKPQDHFIEAQVQEGDTLQAIALRFHCSISELKRINHIHKDNEIFARRTVKVPVTPYSVLTETLPISQPIEPKPSTSQSSSSHSMQQLLPNSPSAQTGIVNNEMNVNNSECAIDCNAVVMNSTLIPSVVPYMDAELTESFSEDTQLLPSKQKVPVEAVVVKELTSHGADFGLKWFHLVCCMLVLGVVIPIIYVLFYLEKPEHEHEHDHENST